MPRVDHHVDLDSLLDESAFRSSLRTVLVVDLALLSLWTAWAHPGPNGLSRLVLVAIWSLPALWSLATRPVLRRLALRHLVRKRGVSLMIVACSIAVTTMLTMSMVLADSMTRSARTAVDYEFGPVDEIIRAATPEIRIAAQQRLDQTLAARSDTVNDLSLMVEGQLGFVSADVPLRNEANRDAIVERNIHVLELDVAAARAFGANEASTGLAGIANPAQGHILLGPYAAKALGVAVGETVVMPGPIGPARTFVVDAILTRRGFGVLQLGVGELSRIAIVPIGTVTTQASPPPLKYVIAVSNRDGSKSSVSVSERLEAAFAASDAGADSSQPLSEPRTAIAVSVDNVKQQILFQAKSRTQPLGRLLETLALLLSLGAGLLLIALCYGVAVSRVSEIGALRSVGLRRRDAISSFGIEGWCHAILGALVGAVVGWAAALVALRRSLGATQLVSITRDADIQSVFAGLTAGFVLSCVAIFASMLALTRGSVQTAFRRPSPMPFGEVRSRKVLVRSAFAACVVFLVIGRGIRKGESFPLLAGLVLLAVLVAVSCQRVLSTKIGDNRSLLSRLVRFRWVLGSFLAVLTIAAPTFFPGIFRHTETSTMVLYACLLVVIGNALWWHFGRVIALPLVRPIEMTTGARRASSALSNAAPSAQPNRELLIRVATSVFVMALTAVSLLRVGLHNDSSANDRAAHGRWEGYVEASANVELDALAKSLAPSGIATGIASFNVEVTDQSGRGARVTATALQPGYATRGPLRLVARAKDLGTDAQVFRELANTPGTAIVDQGLFADGGTRTQRVKVGDRVFIRDLATGRSMSVTMIGVAQSAIALGHVLVSPATFGDLRGFVFAADRLLVAPVNQKSEADRLLLKRNLNQIGVEYSTFRESRETREADARTVLRALGWLMWLGGVLLICARSILAVRRVSERKGEFSSLRAIGMTAQSIRRMAVNDTFQALVSAVAVGWLAGVVVAWRLVWAGSLGANVLLPFSPLTVFGALAAIVVPLVVVDRWLKRSLSHDAPLRRS